MDNPETIATLRTKDKGQKKATHTKTRRKAKDVQHGHLTKTTGNTIAASNKTPAMLLIQPRCAGDHYAQADINNINMA